MYVDEKILRKMESQQKYYDFDVEKQTYWTVFWSFFEKREWVHELIDVW